MKISRCCDQIILATLIILVCVLPTFFDARLYSVFDLTKVVAMLLPSLLIMALWLIKTIFDEQFEFPYTPLNLPILALIIFTIIATIFSISPYISLIGTYKRFEGLIEICTYIFIFFAFVAFINNKRKLHLVINAIVITAAATSIYGFLQYLGKDPFKWSVTTPERIFSTFGNPVFYSAFLITTLPLSLALYLDYKPPNEKTNRSLLNWQLSKDIVYGICTLLIYTIFWHTRTRADFLGLIVLLPVFIVFLGKERIKSKKWKLLIIFSFFFIIGSFYAIRPESSVFSHFASEIEFDDNEKDEENRVDNSVVENKALDNKDVRDLKTNERSFLANRLSGSSLNRYYQFKTGLKIYNEYPLLGIGPDSLGLVYQSYLAKVFTRRKEDNFNWPRHDKIHNDVLDNVVSRGALGLTSYIWVILAYFWMIWKFLRYKNVKFKDQSSKLTYQQSTVSKQFTIDRRLLVVSFGSAILGYLVQNEFSFGNTVIVAIFWTVLALTVVVIAGKDFRISDKSINGKNVELSKLTKNKQTFTIRKCLFSLLVVSLTTFLFINVILWYKADIYMEMGRKHTTKNDFANGLKYYEYAISYNPYEVNYRDMLNNALFSISKVTNDKVWLENVISIAHENLKLIPNHYAGFYALANAYYLLAQNFEEQTIDMAIQYYKKTIEADPFQHQLYHYLAMCYFKKGMYEETITAMKKAILIGSDDLEYIDKLARIYLQLDRIDDFKKLLDETPPILNPTASFCNVKGFYFVKIGKKDDAYIEFKNALNLDLNNMDALNNVINLGVQLQKTDETINYLKHAAELKPKDVNYRMKLGNLFAEKGLLNESIDQFKQIIRIDPRKQDVCLDKLGKIYIAQKDFDNSIICFKEAINLNPSDAELYNNLGAAYAQKKMYDEAITEINRALEINDNNVTFLENLVKIYYVQKKHEETEQILKRIIELDEDNEEAIKLLEKINQKKTVAD